jgi:hypothetical protein
MTLIGPRSMKKIVKTNDDHSTPTLSSATV